MAHWSAGISIAIVAACIRSTAEEHDEMTLSLVMQPSRSQLRNFVGQTSAKTAVVDMLPEISDESSGLWDVRNYERHISRSGKGYEFSDKNSIPFDKRPGENRNLRTNARRLQENSSGEYEERHPDEIEHQTDARITNKSVTQSADRAQGRQDQMADEKSPNDALVATPRWRHPRILGKAQKDVLDAILKGYDVNEWPHFYYGKKTDVHVQMFINAFGSLSAETMEFRIDLFLRQIWQDPRLAYSDKREHLIVVDPETHKRIWRPDTYFDNVKVARVHDVTVPNVMLRITRMGSVTYTMRLALLLTCNMQLQLYPFDTQFCYVDMSSLSSTDEMLSYHWDDYLPIKIADNVEIAEFDLIGYESIETKLNFTTGNYSGLQGKFTLRRQNGFHLLQTYVPTIIIVCMSWVSFWLDPNAVPGRVALGVTTLLTLTTLAAGVRQSLPKVSYIKAVDVWLGMCMVMIFGALIEFTTVNCLANKKKAPRFIASATGHGFIKLPQKTYITHARRIDEFSRILFPAVFLLFNIFYWTYYILRLYQEVPKIPFTF